MCNQLFEENNSIEMPKPHACNLEVHTTYNLGSDPIDLQDEVRPAEAETEVRATWSDCGPWLTEDEI